MSMTICAGAGAGAGSGGGEGAAVTEERSTDRASADPTLGKTLTKSVVRDGLETKIRNLFVEAVQEIVGPYHTRACLIAEGKTYEAIELTPRKIWYPEAFLRALKSLGGTVITVNEKTRGPADVVLSNLTKASAFTGARGHKDFWKKVENPLSQTEYDRLTLELKSGVSPARAFRSFFDTLSFIDCLLAIECIGLNLTLIKLLGDAGYDSLAATFPSKNMECFFRDKEGKHTLRTDISIPPRSSLEEPGPEFKVGQLYYINNHPTYQQKHPEGHAVGLNIVFLKKNSEGKSIFTGLGLNPEGQTLEEIAEFLREEYNKEPLELEDFYERPLALEIKEHGYKRVLLGSDEKSYIYSINSLKEFISGKRIHEAISIVEFEEALAQNEIDRRMTADLKDRRLDRDEFYRETDFFGFHVDQAFDRLIRENYSERLQRELSQESGKKLRANLKEGFKYTYTVSITDLNIPNIAELVKRYAPPGHA